MEHSLAEQVDSAVNSWLRWLPRWQPSTHRSRTGVCRRCFGSPVLGAAGITADVPHAVQHALSARIKRVIDQAVERYTRLNLLLLQAELDQQLQRNRARPYRPAEDLDPEFEGLPLDPDPVAGAPFLFTLSGLADEAAAELPPLPPLSDDEKAALRQEVRLADEYANLVGKEVCQLLVSHRMRVNGAVQLYVEPQVAAMLAELASSLDSPFDAL